MNQLISRLQGWVVGIWAWLNEDNRKKLIFVGGIIAALAVAGWEIYKYRSGLPKDSAVVIGLIDEGNGFLDIGHYGEAKQSFQKVLTANPADETAAWGLKKAELWDVQDKAVFDKYLQNLYQKNPKDAHVNLFFAKLYGADHDMQRALPFYRKALELNPKLAEAHFDLGVLYQQQGKLAEAKTEYEQAVTLLAIPKYQNNLAYLYFKKGDYEQAITLYGRISKYPLSALELAKIYWLRGQPQQAETLLLKTLALLADEALMAKSENQEPWYFAIGADKGIELIELAEKKNYARYCLALSLFLQGKNKDAGRELDGLKNLNLADIKLIVMADLQLLAQARPELGEQIAAFQKY